MKEIKNKSYSVVQSELGLWVLRITPIRYLNYIISNIKKKSTEQIYILTRTFHFPFRLPFSRAINPFSCNSTVRRFIVLSDLPVNSDICF